VFGLVTPGHRITIGTRNLPSQFAAFLPRNRVAPLAMAAG
jgi:hypothetical protein